MKRQIVLTLLALTALTSLAQLLLQQTHKPVAPDGYSFWTVLPDDYAMTDRPLPVIIYLHGASICGQNLNRVKRYGTLEAIDKGLKIEAIVVAPQNPGGSWKPSKINDILEWVEHEYRVDTTRVSVVGMSLGGYGTMDFAGTYPEKIAAAMALCGGCTLKDQLPLGDLPLWIIHGTGDRAVPVKKSQDVVALLHNNGRDSRLRFDWMRGASHGALARLFYLEETYQWLLSHSTADDGRPVNRDVVITHAMMTQAYTRLYRR